MTSVVAGIADRVLVMYAGQIIEAGTIDAVMKSPSHPYTWGLLKSIPRLNMEKGAVNPIWGQPPDLLQEFDYCPLYPAVIMPWKFAPKNACEYGETKVKCWLKHPQAPPIQLNREASK